MTIFSAGYVGLRFYGNRRRFFPDHIRIGLKLVLFVFIVLILHCSHTGDYALVYASLKLITLERQPRPI